MGHAGVDRSPSDHPARGGHRAIHRRSLHSLPVGADCGVVPGYRIWLQVNGMRMFGPGMRELLHSVDDTGSLHRAAKLMGMSYTKAWHLLAETEEQLGWALVERRVGGATGGGTSLTGRGRDLLRRFDAFTAEADVSMRDAFRAAFADWSSSGEPAS